MGCFLSTKVVELVPVIKHVLTCQLQVTDLVGAQDTECVVPLGRDIDFSLAVEGSRGNEKDLLLQDPGGQRCTEFVKEFSHGIACA